MNEAPRILLDSDIERVADPVVAVACMLDALAASATGDLTAPPRVSADVGDGRVVLTAGSARETFGYRVYDTLANESSDQIVVAHDRVTGSIVAVAFGELLGVLRTGALGGAAASLLATDERTAMGVVGAGPQAWAQIWAIASVREIAEVRIASRQPASRETLAGRVRHELGLDATAVDSARDAVDGAGIVVLATSSDRPVIEADWLQSDVLVVTLGHKQVERAEFPLDLIDGATLVTTDSPAQLAGYDPPAMVYAAGRVDEVVALGDVASGRVPPVRAGRRVHLSVGLAGTEPLLLRALARV